MQFRHESKFEINYADFLMLQLRLPVILQRDIHAINGSYEIRSLYFDTPNDKALREKIDGVNHREKYRMRYYNGDTGLIKLEKKSKQNGLCNKQSTVISEQEAQWIVEGNIDWMIRSDRELCRELYTKMKGTGLKPKTIVDYTRLPFVYGPGNVRVTLDYNIRTGMGVTDFLNPETITIPAGERAVVLEVKWDEFLPNIVKQAVALDSRRESAFSKYAKCRIYG